MNDERNKAGMKWNRRCVDKTIVFLLAVMLTAFTLACSGGSGGSGESPAIDVLRIESVEADSLVLARPDVIKGDPTPTVQAYIGKQGAISVNGKEVLHAWQGPVDVSGSSYRFYNLTPDTAYRIVVVAENSRGYAVQEIVQATPNHPFALNDLVIYEITPDSILLKQPSFSPAGNPQPALDAYIGIKGEITISGKAVSGFLEGPVDVSGMDYRFMGLSPGTDYTVYVVADNGAYYAVKQISLNTGAQAPVLNGLSIASTDSTSIAIHQPTFATAGNPLPTVEAYIGINGTITVSGDMVMDYLLGPVDVSASGCQFAGLSPNGNYTLVVMAKNSAGFSTQTINQSTNGIAPVLNGLELDGTAQNSISLVRPAFATAGNPKPVVNAYIGVKGAIEVNGKAVNGYSAGPFDVSMGGFVFTDLNSFTDYKTVVVAENNGGYSVREIEQKTSGIPPELNEIYVSNVSSSTVTLKQPALHVTGNPLPSIAAYIGKEGTIAVSGVEVTGWVYKADDVSQGDHQFTGLLSYTDYLIIVVAENDIGASVKEIKQSTYGVQPELNTPLVIQNTSSTSITIERPSFSVAGNPLPMVLAYIGKAGEIVIDGATISNYIEGKVNVSTGAYQFRNLSESENYTIVVVAENDFGYSVESISKMPAFDPRNLHTVLSGVNASGGVEAVHVVGSTLYAARGREGLAVFDIEAGGNLVFVETIPLEGEAREVTSGSGYTYVTGSRCALWIMDSGGNLVAEHPLLDEPRGSVLYGNYLLIAAGNSGIQVVDVSNPNDPQTETNIVTNGYVTAVDVAGNNVYAASVNDGIGCLDVIDVTNVTSPIALETYSGFCEPLDVKGLGDIAYVADGIGELKIIDVKYKLMKSIDVPADARVVKLTIDADYLYLADAKGAVHVYDITDAWNPLYSDSIDSTASMRAPKDAAVAGNHAFVADGFNGIHVLDVFDKENCTYVRTAGIPGFTRDVAVGSSAWAYVTEANAGFKVIDIKNSSIVKTYTLNDPNGLTVKGSFLYVAKGVEGFTIYDITAQSNPNKLYDVNSGAYTRRIKGHPDKSYVVVANDVNLSLYHIVFDEENNMLSPVKFGTSFPFDARGMQVTSDYIYAAGGASGLHIIQMTFDGGGELSSASEKFVLDSLGNTRDVAIVGNRAFVAADAEGVHVVTLTYSPTVSAEKTDTVAAVELGMNARSIVADGKYLYVGGDAPGIVVLDSENLLTVPYMVLVTPEAVEGLSLFGHTLFVADGFEGLMVFGE